MTLQTRNHRAITLIALLFYVVACAAPQPTPTQQPIATIAPTATEAAPLLVLVAPPQADAGLASAAAEISAQYAADHQLRFEQRQLLDPAAVPAETSKMILLAPDPGATALAAAFPSAQIVTVGFSTDGQFANVVSILAEGASSDTAAFIAGYTAALVAVDWRAGILYTSESQALADDFMAGGEYYCGSCIPLAPPEAEFPMAAQATDAANWQAAADLLLANFTRVVYLAPELESSGAGQYLAGFGVLVIGSSAPPADLAANWLASVSADHVGALRTQLPSVLGGQAAPSGSSLSLSNVNATYLSEAKLANIQSIIDDLMAGYLSVP